VVLLAGVKSRTRLTRTSMLVLHRAYMRDRGLSSGLGLRGSACFGEVPMVGGRDAIDRSRAPGTLGGELHRRRGLQQGGRDLPEALDGVGANEEGLVPQ